MPLNFHKNINLMQNKLNDITRKAVKIGLEINVQNDLIIAIELFTNEQCTC